jgi:predicted nucleic acid-binding protein
MLYSEDFQPGRLYGSVLVVDPFADDDGSESFVHER